VATPHLSARLIRDHAHLADLVARIRDERLVSVFFVAGDAAEPAGIYHAALPALRDLLALDHGLRRIGVPGYPDGHPLIPAAELRESLHAKQAVLADAGIEGWVSTQMCFDGPAIARWLDEERAAGLALPVRLGVPGPVERSKLLAIGMKVGVGQSLRYVKKNRSGLFKLLTGPRYDPTKLLERLKGSLERGGVAGLHLYTFNQIEPCVVWQTSIAGSSD
jgi:methylenetetrahydrofolate reductase (NADPH)